MGTFTLATLASVVVVTVDPVVVDFVALDLTKAQMILLFERIGHNNNSIKTKHNDHDMMTICPEILALAWLIFQNASMIDVIWG